MTCVLEFLANVIFLFGGERTFSDSGTIGLSDSNDSANPRRRDTQSSTHSSHIGGRGSDIGVGAEVSVEHTSIGSFSQDPLIIFHSEVKESHSV